MITVTYSHEGQRYKISVKGHAGEAEPGKDIVCAAASGILWSLYASLEKYCDDFSADMRPGDSTLTAQGPLVETRFETIMEGYRWLHQNYPEYVQIK